MLATVVIQTFGAVVLCSVMVSLFGPHRLDLLLQAGFFSSVTECKNFSAALCESAMFALSTGAMFNQTPRVTEARHKDVRNHHPLRADGPAPPPVS